MAAKQNVDALLRKNLGKEVADQVIRKINQMVNKGANPAQIQRTISKDLVTHVQKQLAIAVIAKSGPLVPIKVSAGPISVKSGLIPIKIGPTIQVKVQPGVMTRGSKK